jgi:phage minor structural protein
MAYALAGTEWAVGTVNVRTKRTWTSSEKNALSILRMVQNIYGGDLVFDSANRLVHLLTFSGTDSGALFSYRKNLKSIQRVVDTRELVTRLYAYGKDGMTFASINGGKEYVEDYTSPAMCGYLRLTVRRLRIRIRCWNIPGCGLRNIRGPAFPTCCRPWTCRR